MVAILQQSKGQKDRTVFLSEDVRLLCQRYDQLMQHWVPDREWFFPGRDDAQPFSKTSFRPPIRDVFSQFAGHVLSRKLTALRVLSPARKTLACGAKLYTRMQQPFRLRLAE